MGFVVDCPLEVKDSRLEDIGMTMLEILALAAVVGAAAVIGWILYGKDQEHDPCVGCGQCKESGVCVLTGKYVGPKGRKKK